MSAGGDSGRQSSAALRQAFMGQPPAYSSRLLCSIWKQHWTAVYGREWPHYPLLRHTPHISGLTDCRESVCRCLTTVMYVFLNGTSTAAILVL